MANKKYKVVDRTSKAKKLLLEEHGITYKTKIPTEGIDYLKHYHGTSIERMKKSARKHNIDVNLYTYDETNDTYDLLDEWRINKKYTTYSALLYSKNGVIHIMYITDAEKLTHIHICP